MEHRDRDTLHRLEHSLGSWLDRPVNRLIYGVLIGALGLLVNLVLNGVTGQDTGFIADYLAVAVAAATGGISSGVLGTAVIVVGQAAIFYQPLDSLLIGHAANGIRLGLFAITGGLVSVITNGLLQARLRAEHAGNEMARLYDAEAAARRIAEEAGRRTQILFETAAGLSNALTPLAVASAVIRQGVGAIGAVCGAVHTLAASGDQLDLVHAEGYPEEVVERYRHLPLNGRTAIAVAGRTGEPTYLADPDAIARHFPDSLADTTAAGELAFVTLPVTHESRSMAVLTLGFRAPRTFPPDERDFYAILAQQTGQALERARLYEAERVGREGADRAKSQATQLQAITTALSQPMTAEEVADVWATQAVTAVGAAAGGIALLDPDETTIRTFRTRGYAVEITRAFDTFQISDPFPAAAAMRTGRPVFCDSPDEIARQHPALAPQFAASGTRAFAVLPFVAERAVRGEAVLSFSEPRTFDAQERAFLAAVANECGQALLRARLRSAEQRARAEADQSRAALEFLAEASRLLASSLDYETALQRVADLAVPLLGDWCAVDLVDPDGSSRGLAVAHVDPASRQLLREFRDRYPPHVVGLGPALVIGSGEPMLVPVITDEDVERGAPNPEVADYARRLGVRSYLAVPVRTSDGVLGSLAFSSSVPGRYTAADLTIAEDLARRVGVAIRHGRLYRDARQLVAIVDAALDAVFMFEPEHLRFTYVNQGAVNQVGFSRDELLGMTALAIKPEFDEAGYRGLLAQLLDGSQPSITFSTTHLHRDGTRVPVEVFLQAVHLPDDTIRMIVTARDIRQQIEAEANLYRLARAERARAAELSAVIRGMGEGVLVCDPTGHVILSNPAAAAIVSSAVEWYDDLVALVEPPAEGMPQLASAGGPVEVRLAGTDRWLDVTTYPVSLESGELSGEAETTIIVLRDVTAARQARAAREAFIGVMSHELRTPITIIYGATKLFGRAFDSPDLLRSMLTDVEEEADRLYRLVEDLLILSRSESGILVEGEPVLLQHVVRAVVAGESARWPATQFISAVPAGLPPVAGDRTYLEQVVRNLLSNAAKYSPPGTRVEVQAELADAQVAVRVLDSGPAFAPEEAEHLFELFYRSASTAKKAAGAGIGLYVSRVLIEAMGGTIWARPRTEGGAEFGFTVPILDDDTGPEDDAEPHEEPEPGDVTGATTPSSRVG